jgi:site-specific DNA-methyltransferase (adenine-specific)
MIDLRLGRWEDALADVERVDAVICDPPYSERTHSGHDDGATLANRGSWKRANGNMDRCRPRRDLCYDKWMPSDVRSFVSAWAPRCAGWFVCFSDSVLCNIWRAAFEYAGLTGFHPIPCVIPGMTVRLSGDGPSSWAVYANVARPKALHRWGTLPGAYISKQGERIAIGGKPLALMRALVRDYTRPGNLICDPCAGGGTTLLAAAIEGRRAIGAEMDPETHAKALARLEAGYTPDMFTEPIEAVTGEQGELL